jgi:peptidoglycan/LPS O-acetylase OafA/YrhL
MAMGGLFAWFLFFKEEFFAPIKNIGKGYILVVYAIGTILCITWNSWSVVPFLRLFERLILASFFVFVIFDQIYLRNSVIKIGNIKAFSWLGTVTYGLYCYHVLCLMVVEKFTSSFGLSGSVFGVVVLDNIIALSLSIGVAFVSYRFFESYFLKLKSKFQFQSKKQASQKQQSVA